MSPHFSFVTDEDLWGRNVLQIDYIATCSLENDYLYIDHLLYIYIYIYIYVYMNNDSTYKIKILYLLCHVQRNSL